MSKPSVQDRMRSVRTVNTKEDAEQIGFELGKKIGEITDKAAEDINNLTKTHGVKVKVAIQFYDSITGEPIN